MAAGRYCCLIINELFNTVSSRYELWLWALCSSTSRKNCLERLSKMPQLKLIISPSASTNTIKHSHSAAISLGTQSTSEPRSNEWLHCFPLGSEDERLEWVLRMMGLKFNFLVAVHPWTEAFTNLSKPARLDRNIIELDHIDGVKLVKINGRAVIDGDSTLYCIRASNRLSLHNLSSWLTRWSLHVNYRGNFLFLRRICNES